VGQGARVALGLGGVLVERGAGKTAPAGGPHLSAAAGEGGRNGLGREGGKENGPAGKSGSVWGFGPTGKKKKRRGREWGCWAESEIGKRKRVFHFLTRFK